MNGEAEVQELAPPGASSAGGGAGRPEGRAEVDTSAPFKSEREAVDRFGGSAAWSSHLIKRMFAPPNPKKQEGGEELADLEEQTAQLEKELSVKERETLDVLRELESTKQVVVDLKLKIQNEDPSAFCIPEERGQAEVPTGTEEPSGVQSENAETDAVMGALLVQLRQQSPGSSVLPIGTGEPAGLVQPEKSKTGVFMGALHVQLQQSSGSSVLPIGTGEPAGVHPEKSETGVVMGALQVQLQQSPGSSVLKGLEQAKANLNRTMSDLAAIRASVK